MTLIFILVSMGHYNVIDFFKNTQFVKTVHNKSPLGIKSPEIKSPGNKSLTGNKNLGSKGPGNKSALAHLEHCCFCRHSS